jgi:hypothetical protein
MSMGSRKAEIKHSKEIKGREKRKGRGMTV